MSDTIILDSNQLKELAAGRCPGCGGSLQRSGFFDDTVMCSNRTESNHPICKMYMCSPKTVIKGLELSPK